MFGRIMNRMRRPAMKVGGDILQSGIDDYTQDKMGTHIPTEPSLGGVIYQGMVYAAQEQFNNTEQKRSETQNQYNNLQTRIAQIQRMGQGAFPSHQTRMNTASKHD